MPATNIAVNLVVRAGLTDPAAVPGDIVNNNSFVNDTRTLLRLSATSGTPTATIVTPGTVDGLPVADLVLTLSTVATFHGPFPTEVYGSTVTVIPSAVTVQITALRI